MIAGSMPRARFLVQADGVWIEVESPTDGRRAAFNLAAVGEGSEVGEVFKEWCVWHVAQLATQEP
jgi:hypothetical protein